MLQHINDSKLGDVVKMVPVSHYAPPLQQPKPSKRVFKDRPTTGLPVLNGIQPGNYQQPTKPVVTPVPTNTFLRSELKDAPVYVESTVNNPLDFTSGI